MVAWVVALPFLCVFAGKGFAPGEQGGLPPVGGARFQTFVVGFGMVEPLGGAWGGVRIGGLGAGFTGECVDRVHGLCYTLVGYCVQ